MSETAKTPEQKQANFKKYAMATGALLALVAGGTWWYGGHGGPPKVVASEAKVGQEQTVEFTCRSAGGPKNGKLRFLNDTEDYTQSNFTVVIPKDLRDDVRDYKGKKLRVTGTVSQYNGKNQIKVADLKQIQVVQD